MKNKTFNSNLNITIKNEPNSSNNFINFNLKYSKLFDLTDNSEEKLANTPVYIPISHINNSNLWLIKPVDLYQGKCLKICDSAEKIKAKVKKFFSGIKLSYKDSDDEKEKVEEKHITDWTMKEIMKERKKNYKKKKNNNKNTEKYLTNCVVLQKYIESPFLYNNRKFDMRIFVLINHNYEVFLFKEGHLKTCSLIYEEESKNPFIHITNYSVQKHSKRFQTFEFGNEVSYQDFEV